jgi:hypothetical protein
LGKGVLWRFSQISTVIFSSTIEEGVETRVRLFGRADIPSHDFDGVEYRDGGFFGDRVKDSDGDTYAASVWDDEALAKRLQVHREPGGPTGATALVVGFFEPYLEQQSELEAIAKRIKAAAEEWFWPVLIGPKPSLVVEVRVIEDDVVKFQQKAVPEPLWSPFISVFQQPATSAKAKSAGDIAEADIPVEIPNRIFPAAGVHPRTTAKATLRAGRGDSGLEAHPRANTVAHIRGHGMVVKYEPVKRKPLDGNPVFGVLKVGLQRGAGETDERAEQFFRLAEPPLHDTWEYTDAIRDQYARGGGRRLKVLAEAVQETMNRLIEEDLDRRKSGPQLLSRQFPFGRQGGYKKRHPITAEITKSEFHDPSWLVEGYFENPDPDDKEWKLTVNFFAAAETGRGDPMAISKLQVGSGATCTVEGGRAEIVVDAMTDRFDFAAKLDPAGGLEKPDWRRTAILMSHSSNLASAE